MNNTDNQAYCGTYGQSCGASLTEVHDLNRALRNMAGHTKQTVKEFSKLSEIIRERREQWLCEGEGQWPDKFTLLNRYVRTDYEPPFILND